MALVISNSGGGWTISDSGGTSAAAPFWAGVKFPPQVFTGYQASRDWDPSPARVTSDAQVLVPLVGRNASRACVNRGGESG
jgi:hypothetical protein